MREGKSYREKFSRRCTWKQYWKTPNGCGGSGGDEEKINKRKYSEKICLKKRQRSQEVHESTKVENIRVYRRTKKKKKKKKGRETVVK